MISEGWILFENADRIPWDEFVTNNPCGRFIHLSGFKNAVQHSYALEPAYWMYKDGNTVKAVFPGFIHKSYLYGKKIVSQPFSEYGGILLSENLGQEEKEKVVESFAHLVKQELTKLDCATLEMRNPTSLLKENLENFGKHFTAVPLFEFALLGLENPDSFWWKMSSKDRNIIAKAQKYGLRMSRETDIHVIRRTFYPLYLKTMKRLGTPAHPFRYFENLHRFLDKNMRLFIVYKGTIPLSSLVSWSVGRTVHITDMCSDAAYFFLKPNDFSVWEFIRWAWEEGYETFDFGPVRYRGQEIFKKKWLMDLFSYSYVYFSDNAANIRNPFSSQGWLTQAASELWRWTVPSWLNRSLGKYFRKEIGL